MEMKREPERPVGSLLMVPLLTLLWKVLTSFLRLGVVIVLLMEVAKHFRLAQRIKHKVEWFETILIVDLFISGIPLGILTALQTFVFLDHLTFSSQWIYQMVKLVAVGVNIIGATYLFWIRIVGWEKYCYPEGYRQDEEGEGEFQGLLEQ